MFSPSFLTFHFFHCSLMFFTSSCCWPSIIISIVNDIWIFLLFFLYLVIKFIRNISNGSAGTRCKNLLTFIRNNNSVCDLNSIFLCLFFSCFILKIVEIARNKERKSSLNSPCVTLIYVQKWLAQICPNSKSKRFRNFNSR